MPTLRSSVNPPQPPQPPAGPMDPQDIQDNASVHSVHSAHSVHSVHSIHSENPDSPHQSPPPEIHDLPPPADPLPVPPPAPAGLVDAQALQVIMAALAGQFGDAISQALRYGSRPPDEDRHGFKPRAPDKFSGKDRAKLPEFLAQCRIYFLSQPRKFQNDSSKILFIGSYLDSPALDWFSSIFMKEGIDAGDLPDYCTSLSLFIQKLESLFGEPDRQHRAEEDLRKLQMKDSHRVTRYSTDFDRITFQLPDWSDRPKAEAYYKGLAPRIKTVMASQTTPRPRELEGLRSLSIVIDENYWEYKNDQSSDVPRPSNNSSTSNSSAKQKSSPPASSPTPKTSKPVSTANPNAKHLGNDGKLLQSEKERRDKEGACRYCGVKGHFVDQCPTRPQSNPSAPAPRGRATFTISSDGQVTSESSADSADSADSSTSGNA